MGADRIAAVIEEIKKGRVNSTINNKDRFESMKKLLTTSPTVVDSTSIYKNLTLFDKSFDPYEEYSCVAPPWEEALICFENKHGNIQIIYMVSLVYPDHKDILQSISSDWTSPNPIDWDEVYWIVSGSIWVGGTGNDGKYLIPTGPCHISEILVDKEGKPLDFHWRQIMSTDKSVWDTAEHVFFQTLSFMNCRNIELVEPTRPRIVRRRIEKTGLKVSTLHVKPIRKAYSKKEKGEELFSNAHHLVRGHFAEYGPRYNKGLLFGKIEGRFYIPPHARGSTENGEITKTYIIDT